MAIADYQVNITMSPDTVTKLIGGNYNLYGFKAVQSTQGGGLPLVWFKIDMFSTNNVINWLVQHQAYTSSSPITPNSQVVAGFSRDINLGQMLNVEAGGTGSVVTGGPSTAISIYNTTQTPFTCGISALIAGSGQPVCAFPLYGLQMDDITPLEKLLLIFSTNQMKTGTATDFIYGDVGSLASYSPGVFIDLTGGPRRAVTYDINEGWSGYVWAEQIAATANLASLLIEDGSS